MEHTTPHRWVARPIEVEAIQWTGRIGDLPDSWMTHPNINVDAEGLLVTTIEGFVGRPDVGDFLVWGTAAEFYWVPPGIFEGRYKHIAGRFWVALPVETEAVMWTGGFHQLPDAWQNDPQLELDSAGLALTTYRGIITRPRIGDYIVQRNGGKFSWVPRAIFEYKYEAIGS